MSDNSWTVPGILSGVFSKAVDRFDSWYNMVTGVGTFRDKQMFSRFAKGPRLSDIEADWLYAEDDVAGRICDAFPEYVLRKRPLVKIKPEKEDDINSINFIKEQEADMIKEFKRLKIIKTVTDAVVWANVFGACFIMPVFGNSAEGIGLQMPQADSEKTFLSSLQLYDRRYVVPARWDNDRKSENYGKPLTYYVMSPSSEYGEGFVEVHYSRLIRFGGVRTSVSRKIENGGFEDSLLQRCNRVLQQFGISWETLTHLIQDANQAVFKMDGYIKALAADEEQLIDKRLTLMDRTRSVVRGLVVDAKDDFIRLPFNWSGIEKPFELLMYRLSLVSRTPVTIIMGRSPAGENATGESDWQNYDGQSEADREQKITPQLEELIKCVFSAKDGPFNGIEPKNWDLKYPPLRALTPVQQSLINQQDATTNSTLITAGVLMPEEVALSKYGPDSESDISIDIEARMGVGEKADEYKQFAYKGMGEESNPESDKKDNSDKNGNKNIRRE